MARTHEDAIETFVSITGAPRDVASQMLAEHGGDLNRAIDAHFNEGDDRRSHPAAHHAFEGDYMAIDVPALVEPHRSSTTLLSPATSQNPFRLLDPFGGSLFDRVGGSSFSNQEPWVSHPREIREIPIEIKDGTGNSVHSRPIIEDITGSTCAQGPEIHGTVMVDEDDEEEDTAVYPNLHQNENKDEFHMGHGGPSAPHLNGTNDSSDIEEAMVQAAIEASKQEAEAAQSKQQDVFGSSFKHQSTCSEDVELAHAVSLSLKTAGQEKSLLEQGTSVVEEAKNSPVYNMEDVGRHLIANGRQGSLPSDKVNSAHSEVEAKQKGEENTSLMNGSKPVRVSRQTGSAIKGSSSTSQPHKINNNEDMFEAKEWGSISNEEHDEAVMLEAAFFGGFPEGTGYNFGYSQRENGYDRQIPRSPSPNLVAQRLLREQQDDEYLASLQADMEKELKAREEAEAANKKEKLDAEEAQKKLHEEEEFERLLAEKETSLPQEPAAEDANAVTLLVRMPDGTRRGRRFLKTDKLQFLFHFIDVGRGVKPGTYRLVRPYPRQAFSDGESMLSLSDLGLTSKQEALFLELM